MVRTTVRTATRVEADGTSRTPTPASVVRLTAVAPVVLVVGELVARRAQRPGSYDPVAQTVSTLAGRGAALPWLMAGTLLLLGVTFLAIAAALRAVPIAGRAVLAAGALALITVAFAPQPAAGTSTIHIAVVFVGVAAFAGWPLVLAVDRTTAPRLRTEAWTVLAVAGTEAAWWGWQAGTHGGWLGVAERAMLLTVTLFPVRVAVMTGRGRRRVDPRSTALLALAAPLVFVVGLLIAQAAQGGPDAVDRSLSALAGEAATARWVMVLTLALVGVLCVPVALGLRTLPTVPRAVLGVAGLLLVVAAASPQPAGGTSVLHMVSAGLAWAGFVAFPLAIAWSSRVEVRLRRSSLAAGLVLVVLAAWFAAQLLTDGSWYGVSQRIVFAAQGIWPARVALGAVRRTREAAPPRSSDG